MEPMSAPDPEFAVIPDELWPGPERGEQHKHRLGYRPLDLARWFLVDGDVEPLLANKRTQLADRFTEVFRALPGTEAGGEEVLAAITANLRTFHPTLLSAARSVEAVHGLDAAARLVPDDLVLMDVSEGRLRFAAASVCAPNRWKMAVKMGANLDEVHRPVPGYQDQVAEVVESSLQRLTPDRPVWRFNWGIAEKPDLYQPSGISIGAPIRTPERAATGMWLRVERQTLRKFAESNTVLFAIRTFQLRLDRLAAHPERAATLLAAVEQIPDAFANYKSILRQRPAISAWLRECAGSS
jgi:dimethylamine monooxygenase subunit A